MADEPPSDSDEDWAVLIVLVDADHRDHGIPDRSVPHDCADFHYPCPTDEPPFISAPLPIHMGGLMRCCIATWEEIAPPAEQTTEGDTLACSYCSSSMVAWDGAWRWNHE